MKVEASEPEATGGGKKKKKKKKKEKEANKDDGYQIKSSEIIGVLTKHITNLSAKIFEDKQEKQESTLWARGFFTDLVHNSIPLLCSKKKYIPLDYK